MDNIENATTNSQVMQLQQLIAGPLVSTIEADALSSRRYYDMLQLIAFEDANEGDTTVKRLRMLKFSYLETNADGSRTKGTWNTSTKTFTPVSENTATPVSENPASEG